MASTFLLFQLASISALIGMTFGWRGVMTKYSGFYDLPTAWSNVFWGLLLGGVYGRLAHDAVVIPYLSMFLDDSQELVNPLNIIIICVLASVASHLLLRRDRVRKGSSQTTSGWALGLAVGGMVSMILIYKTIEVKDLFGFNYLELAVTISGIAIFSPRCEALISSYHGHLMLRGKRWGAVLRSSFWRCGYMIMFPFAMINPLAWIFIIPMTLIFTRNSNIWIWESIPSEGKKRLRKIWARQARMEKNFSKEINNINQIDDSSE